ncbi:ABC transporter ATP-binding protein [Marinomonas sp. UCMA 3892]|uniref:ATP-binding cassette domain-containing protein n=1 Tax=unclassified Marinomonas TaxID=196814 RepID=UPI00146E17EB|nr:ABC transporter ATP-binding protein [Marinomonas sp. UCMA 3892]NLU99491.1 ABC transporter ATP-binding protein [Marinomonas sp. UCMA 3892]
MSKPNLRCLITNPLIGLTLQPALPKLLAGTLLSSLSGLATLAAFWCMVQLISDISAYWVITAIILWLLSAAFSASASWLAHDAEAAFSGKLRRQVANHLTRLPASTLSGQGDQSLRSLVSDDIAKLHHMVAHLPSEIANLAVLPLASITLLISMVGPETLWVLLPGLIASLYYLVVVPRITARDGAARMKVMGEVISAVDDYARGIRVNRIYGRQSGALATYHDSAERFTNSMVMWVSKVATFAGIAVALLQAVATFAIAYLVSYDQNTIILAATLFFSLAIVTPALRLGHGLDYVSTGKSAMGRIIKLLQTPALPTGQLTQLGTPPILAIKDAEYSIGKVKTLDKLNYIFEPSTMTAITGPSGAGKTTLLRILAGLEPLQKGHIQLAQTDISQLDEQVRHETFLLIPQGADVLPATVKENLRLSAPNATDEQLKSALITAQLDIDLNTDAQILSGGERQRIGIARVFLSPAPVILLDEPTSALDQIKATKLIESLEHLARNQDKTIIIVTHDKALATKASAHLELKRKTASGELL